ncbi:DUF167 domain-containing protein [Sphingomonas morindae]|uniref:UPF0235 protein LHA26_12015 n=1 Tax=Sphingomonas morindae TaxID=1541170 RepID=A0ABY4X5B6_9SPHN|nr:DUF167 domain-containing protein [Sphingomonas morindae]USI72030.1 DUF167 domain-containing protein [Sphingomonas morindae]
MPMIVAPDAVTLAVRAAPRAGRTGFAGLVTGADGRRMAALRVAAPPTDGAANAAIRAYLAAVLDVPRGRVALVSGETARIKRVRVSGDGPALAARLAALIG